MAVSKRDPSRKDKLLKYKKYHKMAQKPEMKNYMQVPTWNSTESFTLSGQELEALYSFFNIFAPAFTAVQQVFARGVKDKKINLSYEDEKGNQVPEEEVKAYNEKIASYFKERLKEREQPTEEAQDTKANAMANEAYGEMLVDEKKV